MLWVWLTVRSGESYMADTTLSPALWHRGAVICVLLLLAGCPIPSQRRDVELHELLALYAGNYDTIAQTRELNAKGDSQHEALLLSIVAVDAPLIGDNVYYVQESVASDPRRVISQELVSLQVAAGEPVLAEAQLTLTEPTRWRDAGTSPQVFRSLIAQDVRVQNGCEITWHKVSGGFDGATDVAHCRTSSRATGEALRVDLRLQLRADTIHITERQLDATGNLVQGGGDDPGLLFQRRAN